MIKVIPLGIGSALPSTTYHFSATVVDLENRLFLFDCGEGAQVRFLEAGLHLSRLRAVFITHLHGDHFFGLPGLLSTLSLVNHAHPLTIVGPSGLRAFLQSLPSRTPENQFPFRLDILELQPDASPDAVFDEEACQVLAESIDHNVPTFGYRFEEKDRPGNLDVEGARALGIEDYTDYRRLKQGRPVTLKDGRVVPPDDLVGPPHKGASFAYVTDTRPCDAGMRLAKNAGLLYHEATFVEEDAGRARRTKHATAREAAEIAARADAHRLLIGHFSARYPDADALLAEAREVFQNTEAAEELKPYVVGV